MVMHQRAERAFIERVQHLRQGRGLRLPRREMLPVNFSQRSHKRIAVLAADLAIFVAVPLVQTRLLHFGSPIKPTTPTRNRTLERSCVSRSVGRAPLRGISPACSKKRY